MSEFRRRLMKSALKPKPLYPDPWVDDGYIWAYYNVTDTSSPTTLLYSDTVLPSLGSNFIIDGVSVSAAQTYQFDTTGEHLVKMTCTAAMPNSIFRSLSALVRLYLPDVITSIGQYSISYNENLTHLWLSEELTTIGGYGCYDNTALIVVNLYLPKLTSLGRVSANAAYNFRYSLMPKGVVDFPALTSIGAQGVFADTSIVEVKNLGSITNIPRTNGVGCFANCKKLIKVDVPSTIETISAYSFDGCSALQILIVRATTPPTAGTNFIRNCNALAHIYVPAGSVESYKTASGWSAKASIISAITE